MNKDENAKMKDISIPNLIAPFPITLAVILIGGFMSMLDSSIVNVAISPMMIAFGVGADEIDWILTIYMLVLGVVVPTSGWFSDYFGLKKFYLISLGIFTLGSIFCAMAWSVPSLTFARGIQAIGGGMIMPVTMAMIYKITPRKNIGKAMAGYGMIFVVAPAIGPALGGYLVAGAGWRWIFTINIPIGIAGLILGYILIPKMGRSVPGKFDIWGALLSAAGMFCILFLLSEGTIWGWTSMKSIIMIYASIVFLGTFVWWQKVNPEPLLDLEIFKNFNYTVGNISLIFITIGMYGALFFIPIFLQAVRGMGALDVGLLMLIPALISGLAMPISGALYDKIGPKIPASAGIIILSFGTFMFCRMDINTSTTFIVFWNSVRSIGMGLAMMPIQTALMSEIPANKISRASAMTNIISRVSGAFGIAVLTIIMSKRTSFHSAMISWQITPNNYIFSSGLPKDAQMGILGNAIFETSYVRALNDMFILTGAITGLAILLVIFLNKGELKNGN